MTRADADLQQLCTALGLAFAPQDWGIENARASRLAEFVAFYEEQHASLSATQRFEMGGLILASANEAASLGPDWDHTLVGRFVDHHAGSSSAHVDYWRGLPPTGEFPLARWLRENSVGESPS